MVTIRLVPVNSVRITLLMDNVTDPLLFPKEQVGAQPGFNTRVASAASAEARLMP